MKVKIDLASMKFMPVFENVTGVSAKDCFSQNERIVFIVKEGFAGKAIGKGGVNIRRLEQMFKKRVRVIEHSDDLIHFVKNVIHPLPAKEIAEEDGVVTIIPIDSITRGHLIGRGAVNLRGFEGIVKRFFDIKEIKVV